MYECAERLEFWRLWFNFILAFRNPENKVRGESAVDTPKYHQIAASSRLLQAPRLHAVIIGINDYRSRNFSSLRGAEPDARLWKRFFVDFGVPESQIVMLLGQCATRKNIVKALRDLATNVHIAQGDPIVIVYAGHGGLLDYAPLGRATTSIQVIVPFDYCPGNRDSEDSVYCIPDFIIGTLINQIADKKGNNIMVVMDCCHSASGTRSCSDNDTRVRSVHHLPPTAYSPEIDRGILAEASYSLGCVGFKSHVLLAACSTNEEARESQDHGEFSNALLELFRTVPLDQLRYCDILPRMKRILRQNPQCEGFNQDRFLFEANTRPIAHCYNIQFISHKQGSITGAVLTLSAGSANGITVGAHFDIFARSDTSFRNIVQTVTVKSLKAFTAVMEHSPRLQLLQPCVAVQTKPGQQQECRLFIPPNDKFREKLKEVHDNEVDANFHLSNITLVDEDGSTSAHLRASMGNTDQVTFEMKDVRVTQYHFSKRFDPIDTKDIFNVACVLNRIAHYYKELYLTNTDFSIGIFKNIRLEWYKLGPPGEQQLTNLRPENPNLFRDGVIDLDIDEGAPYGLKLVNENNFDLYVYLFVFNNSDLSIETIYRTSCHSTYPIEDRLKAKGSLTFGYDSSGVRPLTSNLHDDDLHVDFLKIILTTKPIDSPPNISQTSPFTSARGLGPWSGSWAHMHANYPETWDTLLVPVIQRRSRAN